MLYTSAIPRRVLSASLSNRMISSGQALPTTVQMSIRTPALQRTTTFLRNMSTSWPTIKLSSGQDFPACGLGTWQSPPGEVRNAVKVALQNGYRHIDGAAIYGNEAEVGQGIKDSGVPRGEIFVTTKLWNDMHAPEDVSKAMDTSLSKLGLDYVDLYLMHYPCAMDPKSSSPKVLDIDYLDTYKAMEKLVQSGKAKSIGISNFAKAELDHLLEGCMIKPVVHQIERHPYLPLHNFLAYHKKLGIHVSAYSPLGNTNPSYAEGDSCPPLTQHKTVQELCKKYDATPAQVLLAWSFSSGLSVLPKSVTESRIKENFVYKPLAKEDVEKIDNEIKERRRYCDFSEVIGYNYYKDCKIDLQ